MSDLLRTLKEGTHGEYDDVDQACWEAVAEIERLQARVDELEGANARQSQFIDFIRSNVKAALAATEKESTDE